MALDFLKMTELQMQAFVERNPTRHVDDRDSRELTLLLVASKQCSTAFVRWLVDSKGANVSRLVGQRRETSLHRAACPATLSFLITRGADPVVIDRDGWTPLMFQTGLGHPECVARLLEEPRVLATIDAQSTSPVTAWQVGTSALHIACQSAIDTDQTRIIELLLEAGANPALETHDGETPLDFLRENESDTHVAIALLECALSEPQRTFLLSKSRHLIDVLHLMTKTAKKAEETGAPKPTA